MEIDHATSRAKGAVVASEHQGHPLRIRVAKPRKESLANNWLYCVRLTAMVEDLANQVSEGRTMKMRADVYLHAPLGMSKAALEEMLYSICCTIRVHPLSLGLRYQETGRISIGKTISIRCHVPKDMYKWAEGGGHNQVKTANMKPGEFDIPSCIIRLEVVGPILAIVAVEHRLVAFNMPYWADGGEGIILIMVRLFRTAQIRLTHLQTAGEPSMATREFLNRLYNALRHTRIPFLFYSDHDHDGLKIYEVIKYGSQTMSAFNKELFCPPLEWIGPKFSDVEAHVHEYAPNVERDIRALHPTLDDETVRQRVQKWVARKKTVAAGFLHEARKCDRDRWRSMTEDGFLRDHEPELFADGERMLVRGAKEVSMLSSEVTDIY